MKKSSLLFALVAGLLTIGAGCLNKNNEQVNVNNNGATSTPPATSITTVNTDDTGITATVEPSVTGVASGPGSSASSPTESYTNALNTYRKNGHRFQFVNCVATPASITLKKGTQFMIDNRDNKMHQITIGAKTYVLRPYDFAIASIGKAGSYNINCDGTKRASITVQD